MLIDIVINKNEKDILSIYKKGYDIGKMMSYVLSSYAKKKAFRIEIDYNRKSFSDKDKVHIKVKIDDNDSITIALINRIAKGEKSGFVKCLFRQYLQHQNIYCYLQNENNFTLDNYEACISGDEFIRRSNGVGYSSDFDRYDKLLLPKIETTVDASIEETSRKLMKNTEKTKISASLELPSDDFQRKSLTEEDEKVLSMFDGI